MSSFCFFSSPRNSFLMSSLKVLTHPRNLISAGRLFHVFGPRKAMVLLTEAALSKG